MINQSLLSTTSRVETPFIGLRIGEATFGIYDKTVIGAKNSNIIAKINYPNYMTSLTVEKINGAVNTYTINLKYIIRPGDDPNFIDKVLSSISDSWRINISYGDMSAPAFIFKEEAALISKVTRQVDINSSTISYTITAVSESTLAFAGKYTFQRTVGKPSDKIKELLYNKTYGLQDIFYGMRDADLIISKGLIAGDDKVVTIEEKKNIDLFSYINYLVSCMTPITSRSGYAGRYTFVVFDDLTSEFGGPYFKINRLASNIQDINSYNMYELDIGYPGNTLVTNLSVEDNEAYSLYTKYSEKIQQPQYTYRIDNNGNITTEYSPALTKSSQLMKTTQADKTWWDTMVQYPINASVTVKGLLRPALLMQYVRLNVLFYGQKYNVSGVYAITKQTDYIDTSGYR
ncbi:MAG: hypothetical protein ACI3T9_04800, partial [Romboutsia timonensis]